MAWNGISRTTPQPVAARSLGHFGAVDGNFDFGFKSCHAFLPSEVAPTLVSSSAMLVIGLFEMNGGAASPLGMSGLIQETNKHPCKSAGFPHAWVCSNSRSFKATGLNGLWLRMKLFEVTGISGEFLRD